MMGESPSVATFWRMLLPPESFFARDVVRNGSLKLLILRVSRIFPSHVPEEPANKVIDCPEREAIYIITNGGISDPEKV